MIERYNDKHGTSLANLEDFREKLRNSSYIDCEKEGMLK